MGKFKKGDVVKTVEAHPYLALAKGEVGIVAHVEKKGVDGHGLLVNFTDFLGDFDYEVWVARSDVKRVGTKIKHKLAHALEPGDQIILEGGQGTEYLQPIVETVKKVKVKPKSGDTIVSGKGFRVVSSVDDYEKVPVVV